MSEVFEFWPGPMEGVMSEHFVRAADALGLFDRWLTPFFRLTNHRPPERVLRRFLAPFAAGGRPVTVQLMGRDPALLAAAAPDFVRLGAAGINLNFCCPSRQVCSGGTGGAALRHPAEMTQLLAAVRTAMPDTLLSVKIRCGWAGPDELDAIIPALAPADRIIVHHRCVRELYREVPGRRARWLEVMRLKRPEQSVIINGDLASVEEIGEELAATGAAGVMAARGALRDPYLARRLVDAAAPAPETGRRDLFRAVLAEAAPAGGLRSGSAIELSNLLWGRENPYFEQLKGKKGTILPELLK